MLDGGGNSDWSGGSGNRNYNTRDMAYHNNNGVERIILNNMLTFSCEPMCSQFMGWTLKSFVNCSKNGMCDS